MDYGDRDGHGRHGILDNDGTTVLCHECGKRYRALPSHINRAHGLDAGQYRLAHGLPPAMPLESDAVATLKRRNGRAIYARRPDIREALSKGFTRSGGTAAMTRAAQQAAPELAKRAAVRHRRARNAAANAARARAAKRELLDAAAQAAGYPTVADWLADHATLTTTQIAAALDIPRSAAVQLRRTTATAARPDAAARTAAVARVIAGEQLRAVAPEVGIHPDSLRAWVVMSPSAAAAAKAAGYPDAGTWLTNRGRVTAADRAAAVAAVRAGESRAGVARRFGVADVTVGNWVRRDANRRQANAASSAEATATS